MAVNMSNMNTRTMETTATLTPHYATATQLKVNDPVWTTEREFSVQVGKKQMSLRATALKLPRYPCTMSKPNTPQHKNVRLEYKIYANACIQIKHPFS